MKHDKFDLICSLVIIIFLLTFLFILLFSTANPSGNGERIGEVISLHKVGRVHKTWEGELIKGGMVNGSGSFGKPFDFTVSNPSLIKPLLNSMMNGQPIILFYHQTHYCFFNSETDNCIFADSFTIINR